jgi:hypothetical protein
LYFLKNHSNFHGLPDQHIAKVKPCSFQRFVIDGKTQRLDQVQFGSGCPRRFWLVACIGGIFRLYQHDVYGQIICHPALLVNFA